jgi:hypothetical protein
MRRLSGVTNPMPPSSEKRPATCVVRFSSTSTMAPFRPALFVAPGSRARCTVAVKQHAHLAVRQEQVVAAVIRNEEAEAVAMAAHGADDE